MYILKGLSLLIAGSLLSTAVLAQSAVPQPAIAAETDLKPVAAKAINNTIPAPGARIVAETPPELLKMEEQREKAMKLQMEKIPEAAALAPQPTVSPAAADFSMQEAKKIQAVALDAAPPQQPNLTEEQKATMQGKKITKPIVIDQTTGATESKLTPIPVKPITAKPILAPTIEN